MRNFEVNQAQRLCRRIGPAICAVAAACSCGLAIAVNAAERTGQDYAMASDVIAGAAVTTGSERYTMDAALGQASPVGTASSLQYSLISGFPAVAPLCTADASDADGDCVADVDDNCPLVANPDQTDTDRDEQGDACDPDDDDDGVLDQDDAFPLDAAEWDDTDGDGLGDNADPDDDSDGVLDLADNCRLRHNPGQEDTDLDGIGDACDDETFCLPCLPNRGGWRAILR